MWRGGRDDHRSGARVRRHDRDPDRRPRVRPLPRRRCLRRQGAALFDRLRARRLAPPAHARQHRIRRLRAAARRLRAHARRARGAGRAAGSAARLQPPVACAAHRDRRRRAACQPVARSAAVRRYELDRRRRSEGGDRLAGQRKHRRARRTACGRLGSAAVDGRRDLGRRALDDGPALGHHAGGAASSAAVPAPDRRRGTRTARCRPCARPCRRRRDRCPVDAAHRHLRPVQPAADGTGQPGRRGRARRAARRRPGPRRRWRRSPGWREAARADPRQRGRREGGNHAVADRTRRAAPGRRRPARGRRRR